MYQFPEDDVLGALHGLTIPLIGCASNVTHVSFDGGRCDIGAEKPFTYVRPTGERVVVGVPLAGTGVLEVLDRKVTSVEVDASRTRLTLGLEGGGALVFESDGEFENFQIRIRDEIYVV